MHGMMPIMKLQITIALWLLLMCMSCKLEPLSATPNGNAKPSPSSEPKISSSAEQSSTCSLTKAAAPVVEGLKLGITPDEILAILPGSKDDPEVKAGVAKPRSPLGVSDFVVRADKLQPKEKFANINHFIFTLLDGRVSTI